MIQWQKHREGKDFVHLLPVVVKENDPEGLDPLAFILVGRSAGGDYYVTAYRKGDICGGEVEFLDTLAQAKRFAQKIALDDSWTDYLQEETK